MIISTGAFFGFLPGSPGAAAAAAFWQAALLVFILHQVTLASV